jgi:hypothetical protein
MSELVSSIKTAADIEAQNRGKNQEAKRIEMRGANMLFARPHKNNRGLDLLSPLSLLKHWRVERRSHLEKP